MGAEIIERQNCGVLPNNNTHQGFRLAGGIDFSPQLFQHNFTYLVTSSRAIPTQGRVLEDAKVKVHTDGCNSHSQSKELALSPLHLRLEENQAHCVAYRRCCTPDAFYWTHRGNGYRHPKEGQLQREHHQSPKTVLTSHQGTESMQVAAV